VFRLACCGSAAALLRPPFARDARYVVILPCVHCAHVRSDGVPPCFPGLKLRFHPLGLVAVTLQLAP
jgi:hypothetical protein